MSSQWRDILGRLIKVVAGLQNGPVRIVELAKAVRSTIRTVNRDMELLRDLGAPLVFNSVDYTYSIKKTWSIWRALKQMFPSEVTVKPKTIRSRRCSVCGARFRSVRSRTHCDDCRDS